MNSLDAVIRMIGDQTVVIPGHGPVSNKSELVAYSTMIGQAVDRVRALKNEGMSLEQAVATPPLASFDRGEGFIDANDFAGAIYRGLEARD